MRGESEREEKKVIRKRRECRTREWGRRLDTESM